MSGQELRAQIIKDIQAVADEGALQDMLQAVRCPSQTGSPSTDPTLRAAQLIELERRAQAITQGAYLTEADTRSKRGAFWSRHTHG